MATEILRVVIVGLPIIFIYSMLLLCYGYKRGHDAGFDIAMRIRDIDDKAESER